MSHMNSVRALALGASALALIAASPALAQTVVVGRPAGQAPAPVGTTGLTANVALGSNGRLIFNHTDARYVVPLTTPTGANLSIGGVAGSIMDFQAGHTVLSQKSPIRVVSTRPPGLAASIFQPGSTSFFGQAIVRNGAELEIEQYYTLTTRYQGSGADRVSVVTEGDTFAGTIFSGGSVRVEAGGRLTGQGSFGGSSATYTIAGTISPHGFPDHTQNANEGPNGRFSFGDYGTGLLNFTSTAIYEVDVDFTLPDGKLANDTITSRANIVIDDGAQVNLRLKRAEGQTNYQVGRTFRLLGVEQPRAEQHYYQFNYSTVVGVTPPPSNILYLDMAANPNVKIGDVIQREYNGQKYNFTYAGLQTNIAAIDLKGSFTLPDDGSAQLTRYLGLRLQDVFANVNSIVTEPGSKEGVQKSVPVRAYVDLVIEQNRTFDEDADTANGRLAAAALQAIGDHNPLYTRLMNLPVDSAAIPDLPAFFDALSGQLYVGVRGLLTQDAYAVQRSLSRRLSGYEPGGAHLWMDGQSGRRRLDDTGEAARLDETAYGFLTGIDATVTGPWRVGIAGGWRTAEIDSPHSAVGEADVRQWQAQLYTSGAWGGVRGLAGVGYSQASVEARRDVALVDVIDARLDGDYDGTVFNAFGELSFVHDMGVAAVEPFVGYNYVTTDTDPVKESDARGDVVGPALLVSGDQTTVSFATVGTRARITASGPLSFNGLIGWRRGFGDLELEGLNLLNNREQIAVRSANLSENAAVVEAGVRWRVTDRVTLDAGYDGVIGDEGHDHAARVGVSLRF